MSLTVHVYLVRSSFLPLDSIFITTAAEKILGRPGSLGASHSDSWGPHLLVTAEPSYPLAPSLTLPHA